MISYKQEDFDLVNKAINEGKPISVQNITITRYTLKPEYRISPESPYKIHAPKYSGSLLQCPDSPLSASSIDSDEVQMSLRSSRSSISMDNYSPLIIDKEGEFLSYSGYKRKNE